MYEKEIIEMLNEFHIMPKSLLSQYLQVRYNLSANLADGQIFSAVKRKKCRFSGKDNEYVALKKETEWNLLYEKRAKAFAVFMFITKPKRSAPLNEPYKYPDFVVCNKNEKFIDFIYNGYNYEIYCIPKNYEALYSEQLRKKEIPQKSYEFTRRVLIYDKDSDLDKFFNVGFTFFFHVDDDYNVEYQGKVSDEQREDAWSDVSVI